MISPQAVTVGESYRLFHAALDSVGLTVEPSGKFLRIVDTNAAKGTNLPYYGEGQAMPKDKRFITKLVRVENLDATELVNNVLNRIKGPAGTSVTLGVLSPGRANPRVIRVRRARIHVPIAAGRLIRHKGVPLAYVRLAAFDSGAHGAVVVRSPEVSPVVPPDEAAVVLLPPPPPLDAMITTTTATITASSAAPPPI